MLRPAPAPAARDWRAPKDAMGFTEELVLEVGEEPAVQRRENKNQLLHITKPSDILPIQISHVLIYTDRDRRNSRQQCQRSNHKDWWEVSRYEQQERFNILQFFRLGEIGNILQ